jgi:DNA-binding transcriptional ArsR family regulator
MNKEVFRQNREAQPFTQIPLSILKDKRIPSGAFRTLVMILSEAKRYKLYKIDLAEKLGTTEKTIQNHFVQLENLGYIRRKKQGRGNFYLISEFGNLNNSKDCESAVSIEVVESSVNDKPKSEVVAYEENNKQFKALIDSYGKHLDDSAITDCISLLVPQFTTNVKGKSITNIPNLKAEIDRVVAKRKAGKVKIYNALKSKAKPKFNRKDIRKKGLGEFEKKLRVEIFDKHNDAPNYDRLTVSTLKANRIVKRDYETELQDASSGYD